MAVSAKNVQSRWTAYSTTDAVTRAIGVAISVTRPAVINHELSIVRLVVKFSTRPANASVVGLLGGTLYHPILTSLESDTPRSPSHAA